MDEDFKRLLQDEPDRVSRVKLAAAWVRGYSAGESQTKKKISDIMSDIYTFDENFAMLRLAGEEQ